MSRLDEIKARVERDASVHGPQHVAACSECDRILDDLFLLDLVERAREFAQFLHARNPQTQEYAQWLIDAGYGEGEG